METLNIETTTHTRSSKKETMSTLDSIPQLVTLLKDCTGQLESKKNDASPFVIFQTLGALHGFMGGQITALQAQITALQAKKSEYQTEIQKLQKQRQQQQQQGDTNASAKTIKKQEIEQENKLSEFERAKRAAAEKRRQEAIEKRRKAAEEQKKKELEKKRRFMENERRKLDLKAKAASTATMVSVKNLSLEEKMKNEMSAAFQQTEKKKTEDKERDTEPSESQKSSNTPANSQHSAKQPTVSAAVKAPTHGQDSKNTGFHPQTSKQQPVPQQKYPSRSSSTQAPHTAVPIHPFPSAPPQSREANAAPPKQAQNSAPTEVKDKYKDIISQKREEGEEKESTARSSFLKREILLNWALQPPGYQQLKPIDQLICSIHTAYPPAFGTTAHSYFDGWKVITREDIFDDGGGGDNLLFLPDEIKLKKAIRKVRFFLHPDKLPRDLNDEQGFVCKLLWDVTNDAFEDWRGSS